MSGKNLVLAGFMGTGKSTVGRLAASRLGWPFVDTDHAIEERAGVTIPELFERGEAHFRRWEAAVCREVAAEQCRVIAVGGGALLDPANRAVLGARGVIICLTASLETIVERVGLDEGRPLFGTRQQVAALLEERQAHYDSLPHHVETSGRSPEAVAEEVIKLWQQHSSS